LVIEDDPAGGIEDEDGNVVDELFEDMELFMELGVAKSGDDEDDNETTGVEGGDNVKDEDCVVFGILVDALAADDRLVVGVVGWISDDQCVVLVAVAVVGE